LRIFPNSFFFSIAINVRPPKRVEVPESYLRQEETACQFGLRGVRLVRFAEIFGDGWARICKLRPRNTIAIPIVLLLLLIGAGILTAGYYINKSVFHAVF